MKTTLIVDSGSTKSIWSLVQGKDIVSVETEGLNPYYHSEEHIQEVIQDHVKRKFNVEIEACYFYGAGCTHARYSGKVKRSIKKILNAHHVKVNGDLLGAARAACQQNEGVIAILGTGSISGYYDGEEIVEKVPALGYVLGDEGSGTYLGKMFLNKYLRGDFAEDLMDQLEELDIEEHEVIEKVYTKPFPNRYLASFAKKLVLYKEDPEIELLIENNFVSFFEQHVNRYQQTEDLYLIGSIAWGFKDILLKVAENYQVKIKSILKNPMQGLIDYHVS